MAQVNGQARERATNGYHHHHDVDAYEQQQTEQHTLYPIDHTLVHNEHHPPTHDAATSMSSRALIARGQLLLEAFQRRQHATSSELPDVSLVNGASTSKALLESSSSSNIIHTIEAPAVTTWHELLAAQQQSAQLLDAIDTQLQQLYATLAIDTDSTAASVCNTLQQLLQHKRATEHAAAHFVTTSQSLFTDANNTNSNALLPGASTATIELLQRAYSIKSYELEQLCESIALPPTTQRVIDDDGVTYFLASTDVTPQLHDPRVAHAAAILHTALSSSTNDICAPPDDGTTHHIDDFATPLPRGWEMRAAASGAVFFVNRHTNDTTWRDPRSSTGEASDRIKLPCERRKQQAHHHASENTVTAHHEVDSVTDNIPSNRTQVFDVVFNERGPIGIHFQANDPDGGAIVRRLLPGTAAMETGILKPYDQLVAVNQHPVDHASFRHVMLLLQGGLRPLTLSFKRAFVRRSSGTQRQRQSDAEGGGAVSSNRNNTQLDEEVVLDAAGDDDGDDSEHSDRLAPAYGRRSSRELLIPLRVTDDNNNNAASIDRPPHAVAPPLLSASSLPETVAPVTATLTRNMRRTDDESVADKIITNLFSLFWSPPETVATAGDVQTV